MVNGESIRELLVKANTAWTWYGRAAVVGFTGILIGSATGHISIDLSVDGRAYAEQRANTDPEMSATTHPDKRRGSEVGKAAVKYTLVTGTAVSNHAPEQGIEQCGRVDSDAVVSVIESEDSWRRVAPVDGKPFDLATPPLTEGCTDMRLVWTRADDLIKVTEKRN